MARCRRDSSFFTMRKPGNSSVMWATSASYASARIGSQRGHDGLLQVARGELARAGAGAWRGLQRRRDLHDVAAEEADLAAQTADQLDDELGGEPVGLGRAGGLGEGRI